MNNRFYYKNRLVLLIGGLAVLAAVLYFNPLTVLPSIASAITGALCGILLGLFYWRKMRKRIFTNLMILYASEGFFGVFTLFLFLIAEMPLAAGRLSITAAANPQQLYCVLLGLSAAYVCHAGVLFLKIRAHELTHGPLRIRQFDSPSVTGSEGMVGKLGTVVDACSPAGRVRIGNELWNARSMQGEIGAGAAVVVCDIEGLTVKVEPI